MFSVYVTACWFRYRLDTAMDFVTPDNWHCTIRDVGGKRRCKWADECKRYMDMAQLNEPKEPKND